MSFKETAGLFSCYERRTDMNDERLTPAQEILLRYCHQRGMTGIEITGNGEVRAMSREGEKLRLTINVYGDIMNADTKKIIADGNTSHDFRHIYELPDKWTDRKPSVRSALKEKEEKVRSPAEKKQKIRTSHRGKER